MKGNRRVWLVGMMGSGKSTVGPALARSLGWRFIDTDAQIEREAGRPIAEIFRRDGEGAFRRREREAIDALIAGGEAAVIALGGGAIAQPGARERLAHSGTIVYLRARPETLLARLGDCLERPLLRNVAPEKRVERVRELLTARRAAYESASIVVDTDEKPPEELVESLARRLGAAAGGAR